MKVAEKVDITLSFFTQRKVCYIGQCVDYNNATKKGQLNFKFQLSFIV